MPLRAMPLRSRGRRVSRWSPRFPSLALGTRFGIRCAPYRLCRTPEDAVHALRELDGPVAVKGCSADIAHKSELGIVRLGVRTEGEVRAAFAEIERRIAEADAQFDG